MFGRAGLGGGILSLCLRALPDQAAGRLDEMDRRVVDLDALDDERTAPQRRSRQAERQVRHANQLQGIALGILRNQLGVGHIDGVREGIREPADPQLGVELVGNHRLESRTQQAPQEHRRDEPGQRQPDRHRQPDPRKSLSQSRPTHVSLQPDSALSREKGCGT